MGAFADMLGQPDEELPEPLTTPATEVPKPKAPAPKSAFRSMLDAPDEDPGNLAGNLLGATQTTPDAHAKAVENGKVLDIPADVASRNAAETEKQAKLQRWREALNDAPKMQKLLAEDPDIAKLAADEIELLSKNEKTLTAWESFKGGIDLTQGSIYSTLEATGEAFGLDDLTAFGREGRVRNEAEAAQYGKRTRFFDIDSAGAAGRYVKETAAEQVPLMAGPVAGGLAGAAIGGTVGASFFGIGAAPGAVIGGVIGAFLPSLVLGVGEVQSSIKQKDPDAVAPGYAFGAGALIAALDSALPGKVGSTLVRLLGREGTEEVLALTARRLATESAKSATLEGVTEVVQEVIGEVAASQATGQEIDTKALAEQAVEAFVAGFLMGGTVDPVVQVAGRMRDNRAKAAETKRNTEIVDALIKGTADSKLRDRNPDAFSAVMAAQTQGTPVETFYVPTEKLMELFQAPGAEEQALAAEWAAIGDAVPGLREQLAEAVAVGGDVEISAADYLTHIAPTDLHGRLKNDIRASRDGWSVNDAKAYAEDPAREAEVAALVERQADAATAAAPGQAVFDQAYTDLMDTGRYTSAQAAEQATLTRERFVGRAARFGNPDVTPEDLYKESRLQILGPTEAGDVAPAGALDQRAAKPAPPLGTDPKEREHTVVDILYGDAPAIKANTREVGDIARDLMTRGSKALRALGVKGGVIAGPDPKTDEIISRAIAAELKAALEKSSRNASDWYTRKVEEAMAIAATMHPEIATDPIAQMGFTAALAITSQGETVPSNVRLADPIYRIFRETGRFPTEVKAKNGPAMGINFAKLNKLLDERGPEGTRAFLHGQYTVGDLKKAGYPIGGENVGTVVYGSAILGPKIGGGFFQNLNRNYSPVTMDLWFMRAWGRITGTLVGNTNPESLAKQKARLTTALEAAGRKVPKTDATLEKQAEEIRTAHERDFIKNRAAYDSGEKTKAELTYAAERYLIGLNGINEQPGSGSERVWMRERVGRAQELLAQEGIKLTAADAQAVWWYPEKDLYAKLGGRDSEAINVDYAGALTELARSKGVSDDTITRAVGSLDQRSGSARRTDDGRADDGGGQGDQGSGAGVTLFQAENTGRDARGSDPGPDEPKGLYARGSGGSGGKLLLGDLPAVARWEPTGNGPVLFELEPSPAAAQAFSAAIRASKENNDHGAAVYVYPDEDYAGMRMFLTEDHLAGIALKGDDTVSVFNTRGSPHKKAGVHLVRLAVQLGGRRLDAFDTVLPEIYAQAGFSVAARLPWDESQAPDGWDKGVFGRWNNGAPDVVFMAYTGRTGKYVEGEGPYAVDYDDAVRLQREAADAYEIRQDPGRDVETLFQANDAGGAAAGRGDRPGAVSGQVQGEPGAAPADSPQRLKNLPASSLGPLQSVRDAAARHMRAMGLPVRQQAAHVTVDPDRGGRIAGAYEAMAHDPQNPEVQAAYRAMIDETLAQYQLVKEMGITVEVIEPGMPDPYPGGPREAVADMHRGHLWLYPTDAGFGTLTEIADNPLLEPTNEVIGDRRLVANDVFRIVHDVFGHGKEGVGFGPSGEENAWQSHVRMYSPLAARAVTSETRGQNSWVNFGPYGESNRADPRNTVYADQKVGLMPEWTATEGLEDAPSQDGSVAGHALSLERRNQVIVIQALKNRAGGDTQKLANVLESVAGLSEADSLDRVPSLVSVLAHMRSAISDDPKVLDAVVGSVPVDVVNDLFGSESAAKVALHNEAMLEDSPAFNADLPVSRGLGDTANAVGLLVRQVAASAAEVLRVTQGAGREAGKGGGALGARQSEGLGQGVLASYQRTRDPHGNLVNIIRLTQNSNLSSFLHESGHFYLFQLIDDSFDPRATPEARVKLKADLKVILDHVGIKIDLATATADQVHAAMTREAHELWARSFEVYLREGKAPSSALRDAFASFASWLVRIYKSLKTLPDYTKRLTPEVRGIMDRLLATDEAIADAQASASFRVPAALRTVMTPAEQRSLERLTEEATHEARAELQRRVMAELARERREWWKEERARVRGEVETEVRNRPAYRAYNLLRHGETPDGSPTLDADGNPSTTRLDRAGLTQAYGRDVLKKLSKGVSAQSGVSHEVFAGLVGFGSGDELVDALKTLQPMKGVIDAETDARMKAKHGDMLTDGRLQADAAEIVLNQKQVELAALQAKVLERLAAGVDKKASTKAASGKREAVKQVRRLQTGLDAKAIAAAAKKAIAGKRIEDAVPAKYRAQADRLGREVEVAIAKQDYELAARLKEQQVVNLTLAKEAQDVQAAVGKALKRFARLRKPDAKLAKGTDIEFIGAARAMLSRFGLSSPQVGFDQQVWYQHLEEQSPAGAAQLRAMIDAATAGAGQVAARGRTRTRAKPGGAPTAMGDVWRQMTVEEFRSLTDTVDAILSNGRDARSVQLGEERVEIKAASDELLAQASGRDSGKRIGQTQAITDAEKRALSFRAMAAFLERTEAFVRRMDEGKVGPFTRRILQPVLAAIYPYRAAKTARIKQMVDILEPRKADLLGKPIHSNELDYTFGNKGELLHALLHSGNDSNFRKLLLGGRGKGRAWGKVLPDGSLDTSRWDSMIRRMAQEGVLTKADYDTAQQIWDLLEELKGPAQVAHRRMFGFYFKEVEVTGIRTPFGKYRGGYAPAISDRRLNPEAGARVDANAMGDLQNAGILPSVVKGFTKGRVEYNQPLELNISKLVGHMDTVLKFTYLGPVIRDVTRLVTNREFRAGMFGIDPHAIDEVLVPWLQRVARQTAEIPFTSEGARTFGKFFKALQRHTGIAAMAGNLLNAAQQVTGLFVGTIRVKSMPAILRGLVATVGAPRQTAQTIMAKSAFMADRMNNSTQELMTTLDDLLTDKSAYRKLKDKTDKHGYFAQVFMQNLVDRAVWLGGYEKAVARGLTEDEAVLEADSIVRTTQGSFAPEDVSRVEVQNAFVRPFVQFYSYFNAQLNVLRTEFDATIQELGWAGGSPRLFYIYVFGALIPAVLADAMMQAATGQLGDDDDDGLLDDIGELFVMSQLRYFAAMVPAVGTAVNFGIHLFNDKPYDDRLSVAPVVSQAERIGGTVVKLATGKESTTGRAVQDALMLISMLTGLPLAQLGKPLGYFTDVGTGEQEGATVGDWIRGTLTGREAPPK